MPDLTATRPAAPNEDDKARIAAAVEAARDEIVDLSHRIHADPEPAFEEHHAAAWIAEILARHGFDGRASGGQPRDGDPRHATRRSPGRRPAHRDPRRVRRAARPGPWLRPQHDGRVRSRGRHRARRDRRRPAGRDRLPRHAGRGAGEWQADHDRRRAVRGHRRGPPVPPVRPLARRVVPARLGGRRRRLHGTPVARVVRPVARQERARRADPAVHLGRAVAPAAEADGTRPRHHPRGRHGRQHHPGPGVGLVHDPERRRRRLRRDARPLPRHVHGRRARHGHDGRGHLLRPRPDDEQQPASSPSASAPTWPPTASRTRATTRTRARPTWPTSPGSARPSTRTSRSRPRARPATRSSSATPPRPRAPTRRRSSPRPSIAQTALDLFRDPALVAAAWSAFRDRTDRATAKPADRAATIRRGAPRWTSNEPAAPPARRT